MAGADRVEGTPVRQRRAHRQCRPRDAWRSTCTPRASIPSSTSPNINEIRQTVEYCNQLPVHPRHPYVGDLVFTAFSGSHQDAINKGFKALQAPNSKVWEVPYLPIDPADLGRTYEAIIRINSQSGKGGIAYILKSDYGIDMPRLLQVEFSKVIQQIADETGKEIQPALIWDTFRKEYLENTTPVDFHRPHHRARARPSRLRLIDAKVTFNGKPQTISGHGNGPIAGYVDALGKDCGIEIRVRDYHQHATGAGDRTPRRSATSRLKPPTGKRAVGRRHGLQHRHGLAQGGDVRRQPRGRRQIAVSSRNGVLYDCERAGNSRPFNVLEIQPMSESRLSPTAYVLIGIAIGGSGRRLRRRRRPTQHAGRPGLPAGRRAPISCSRRPTRAAIASARSNSSTRRSTRPRPASPTPATEARRKLHRG